MGKAFRRVLDRRGAQGRYVGVHTMVSSMISVLLELQKALERQPELPLEYASVLEEFKEFEACATNYLKGGR